jgi:hypothetical protein
MQLCFELNILNNISDCIFTSDTTTRLARAKTESKVIPLGLER